MTFRCDKITNEINIAFRVYAAFISALFRHDYLSRYAMFGTTWASCGRTGGEKPDEIVRSVEVLKIADHPRVRREKMLRGISNFLFAAAHISIHNAPRVSPGLPAGN
jgi:hypothetical protein